MTEPPVPGGTVPSVDVPETAQCLNCGYLLQGLIHCTCPECAQVFDPADPTSYFDPTRKGRVLRPLKPINRADVVIAIVLAVATILARADPWAFSILEWLDVDALRLRVAGILLTAGFTGYILLVWRDWRRCERAGRPHLVADFNRHRWRWRIVRVAFVLTITAAVYSWPAALRFYVSWPWLAAQARAFDADPKTHRHPGWVGVFQVEELRGSRFIGYVWFRLRWSGNDQLGIARYYAPPGTIVSGTARGRMWVAPGWCYERW